MPRGRSRFGSPIACRSSSSTERLGRSPPPMRAGAVWRRACLSSQSSGSRRSSAAAPPIYSSPSDLRSARAATRSERMFVRGSRALGLWRSSDGLRVHPSVSAANPPVATLSSTRRAGHWFFDGWQCARDQLRSAGVPSDQIFVAELCTASHGGAFCSYRRDGAGVAGRMVGVISPDPLRRLPGDPRAR